MNYIISCIFTSISSSPLSSCGVSGITVIPVLSTSSSSSLSISPSTHVHSHKKRALLSMMDNVVVSTALISNSFTLNKACTCIIIYTLIPGTQQCTDIKALSGSAICYCSTAIFVKNPVMNSPHIRSNNREVLNYVLKSLLALHEWHQTYCVPSLSATHLKDAIPTCIHIATACIYTTLQLDHTGND